MPGLLFSNAALLAGLGALAIPILIHLLLKQKRKPLRFSTIQFFQKRDEKTSQRRKLRNLMLLALRVLLLALLVLAFARPYLPGSAGVPAAGQCRQIVLVLDRSASMQAGDRWAKAMEQLQNAVAGLAPADRVALIDSRSPAEIMAPLGSPDALKPILKKLEPGFGTSDLAAGLKTAVQLLAQSDAGGTPRIEVISDFQKSACAGLAGASVPKGIELTICPVAETATPNLALEALARDEGRQALIARARNYSAQNAPAVRMSLLVDGVSSAAPSLSLPAGTTTQVSLSLPRLGPGWHSVETRMAAHDSFALDDVRYETIFIPKPQRVLCVEQRASSHPFEEETFFVASALAPETTNGGPYAVAKATPEEAAATLAETSDYALVVVPGLRQIPPNLAPALTGFVTNGGGLILFLGGKLNAARYNEDFHELLPALPGLVEGDDDQPQNFWHLRHYEREGLIFAAFKEPDSGDVTLPEFRHRFTLTTLDGSRVEAEFNDGTPLIVSKKLGRGRIVLVNTSADTAWTDWPKRKTFLPWLYGLASHATQRAATFTADDDASLLAGFPADLSLEVAANVSLRVREPSSRVTSAVVDAQGQIALNPEHPGFYSIQDAVGHELRRVAVNVAAAESDLQSFTPGELDIPRTNDAPKDGLMAGILGDDHREWWRFLLLAAVALLFLEPLLANRSYA
ncbi:MAG: VWA domain-containing protein [Verrucomicrobiota bacterium]|jgi:hypothetical protein